MASNKVKVNIFGNSYTIQGEASDEYIEKLAGYLNQKMNEVHNTISSGNSLQVAILAALNIVDEYFQMKEIDAHEADDVFKKTKALVSMLEEGLIGDYLNKEQEARYF